ncbi:MAG: hypothetical protein HY721_17430 [Planctomycetes bacterium]|nr:hypothetical protein [Planctomycetota bacterium]
MSRHTLRSITLAGLLAVCCALLSAQGEPSTWRPKSFTLVYNVNNAGYIDVCGCKHKEVKQGSLTRRSSFLRQLRASGRQVLLVDGGSSLFPIEDRVKEADLPEALRSAELIIEAYNRMGYQALAVGAFDLAAGLEELQRLQKRAKFPFLSANLADKETGRLYFPAHAVVEVGGVRVGIFGLTLNTLGKVYLGKVAPAAVVTDPLLAARRCLEELRGKADLVIALSHLREETNSELLRDLQALEDLAAPEVLIDPYIQYGNHHTWLSKDEEWLSFKGDTLFLRGDGQGARLGVVDIEVASPRAKLSAQGRSPTLEEVHLSGEAAREVESKPEDLEGKSPFRFFRISLEPHHRNDLEIDELVKRWKEKADPAAVPPMEQALPRKGDFLTVESCRTCHPKQYESWRKTKHAETHVMLVDRGDEDRFDCIGCHSTGYGEAFLDTGEIGAYANVQCEACHGTSPKHAQDPAKFPIGKVARETCIACHNKEVIAKELDFYTARPKVQCPKG